MNSALRRAVGGFLRHHHHHQYHLPSSSSSSVTSNSLLQWSRCYASAPLPTAGSLGSMGGGGGWSASVRPGVGAGMIPEGGFFLLPPRDQIDPPPPAGFSGGGEGGSFLGPGVAPRGDGSHLMAVPKRKVTPSRKGKRNQFRRIKFIESVQRCKDCGKAKRPHIYCDQCSTNIYDNDIIGNGVGSTTPP